MKRRACFLGLAISLLPAAAGAHKAPDEQAPYMRDLLPSTYRPLPRTDTLIVHAIILDGDGHRIDDGELLMRDGKVAAIGHDLDAQGATVIDAHGRWVTPGIIDDQSSDVSELSGPNAAGTWIETAINPQDPAFSRALAGALTGAIPVPMHCYRADEWQ